MKYITWVALGCALGMAGCSSTPKSNPNAPQFLTQKIYHAPAQIFDFDLGSTVLRGQLKMQDACDASGTSLDIRDQLNQQIRIDTFNIGKKLQFVRGAEIGSTTVGSDGTWSLQPNTALSEGEHAISFSTRSGTGAESNASLSALFTVNRNAPPVYDSASRIVIPNGGVTNQTRPFIRGKGIAGQTITLYDGNKFDDNLKVIADNLIGVYQQKYQATLSSPASVKKGNYGDVVVARLQMKEQSIDLAIQVLYGYAYVVVLNSPFVQNDAQQAQQSLMILLKSLAVPGKKLKDSNTPLPIHYDTSNGNVNAPVLWQKTYCS